MAGSTNNPTPSNPLEATVASSRPINGSSQSAQSVVEPPSPVERAPFLGFLEGSMSAAAAANSHDLRERLITAGWVTSAALVVFLVYRIFVAPLDGWISAMNYGLHTLAMVSAGGSALMLMRQASPSLTVLRICEAAIFLPAFVCLAVIQWTSTVFHAHSPELVHSPLPQLSKAWLLIMFGYAIFIPNHWKRAAVIEALVACSPIAIVSFLCIIDPLVLAAATTDISWVLLDVIALVVGAFAAVFGVFTINRLRTEVAEAREFGQYRLTRLIGSGGMGEVYLAEHLMMRRPCAVKLIRPEKAEDPTILARFEREVQLTAKLSHWNNIDIFDYGRTPDGSFYYVMEFLPGMSLSKLVSDHGPLPAGRVIYLLTQICGALNEAHSHGLVHRDIKPANIFAAYRGGMYDIAKLLDFGLVRSQNQDEIGLTMMGSVTGSPLFISPEQVTGEAEVDPRIDIYAIGGVAYYLLTGTPPFQGERAMKVMIAHVNESPEPPSARKAGVPEDLEAIVLKCLAKNPSDRFANADELLAALQACQAAHTWNASEARMWWGMNEETHLQDPLADEKEIEESRQALELVDARDR